MSDAVRAQVLYDGQCAFCRKSVELLRRLDWRGRLAYVDARDSSRLPAGAAVVGGALAERGEHLGVEAEDVPVQRVEGADGPVGEAVDDFEAEPRPVEQAEDAAAALGAEVERQEFLGCGHRKWLVVSGSWLVKSRP